MVAVRFESGSSRVVLRWVYETKAGAQHNNESYSICAFRIGVITALGGRALGTLGCGQSR